MKYIPNTKEDIAKMLEEMGISSFEDLVEEIIPKNLRLKEPLSVGAPESEIDLILETDKIKNKIKPLICFNGGGVYDHHVYCF